MPGQRRLLRLVETPLAAPSTDLPVEPAADADPAAVLEVAAVARTGDEEDTSDGRKPVLCLFGSLVLRVDGREVEPGPQAQARVLAALAVDAGFVVPTETLVDRVWDADVPVTARRSLQSHLTRLRRTLTEAGASVSVVRRGSGYALEVDPALVDIHLFRRLRDQALARECPPEDAARLLERALGLWSGPALAGIGGEWAERVRAGLESEAVDAAVTWARVTLAIGDHERVVHRLHTLVLAHPLVESLVESLIRALHAAGRGAEAVDAYLAARERLVAELGTEPGQPLRELYEAVLRDELPIPRPAATVPPAATVAPAAAGATVAAVAPAVDVQDVAGTSGVPAGLSQTRPAETAAGGARPAPSSRRRMVVVVAVAFVAVLVGVAGTIASWSSGHETKWDVVDDFTESALRGEYWSAYEQLRGNGSVWSPSAVRASGGELRITGTGREPTGRGNVAGGACWCKEAAPRRTYGIWEVEAKFDAGAGYGAMIGLWPESGHEEEGFLTLARMDLPDRRRAYSEFKDRNGKMVTGTSVVGDFTDWNTFTIEWRRDFVAVRLNGETIFDTRQSGVATAIPNTSMYLYVQVVAGPDGPIVGPKADTPDQVVLHLDQVRFAA
jgi:DNA-binding SARP family transcriptional activator